MTEEINHTFELIASRIPAQSSVLDVGCGAGDLLSMLDKKPAMRVQGLEISRDGVASCVSRGLSVVQGDANTDLRDYPDRSFDNVILTQAIQAMYRPLDVLDQALRIGNRVFVSTPNFAHWRLRLSLLFSGRMPQSLVLPTPWHETDNIHLCTLSDFIYLCTAQNITLEAAYSIRSNAPPRQFNPNGVNRALANLRAEEALFILTRD